MEAFAPNDRFQNPHDLPPVITEFFKPGSRTSSRSPRRTDSNHAAGAENIYRDLSPSKTLRAIVASSGPVSDLPHDEEKLIKSIENATEGEKEFGVKVAEGSKLVKQWCAELEAWPWDGQFSPPLMDDDGTISKGTEDYFVVRANRNAETPDEEFWGSLSSCNVVRFEQRLDDIRKRLVELDLEDQKRHVLQSHNLSLGDASENLSELQDEAEYSHLDGLTALITVTVLQALPFYARLSTLVSVWAARLVVLRQVPGLFRELAAARNALDKAWYSLRAGPAIAFNAIVFKADDQALGPDSYHGIEVELGNNIKNLGKRIDLMLDALESQEETLPDHWIDMVEALEKDYVGWTEQMHDKLARDQMQAKAVPSIDEASVDLESTRHATNILRLNKSTETSEPYEENQNLANTHDEADDIRVNAIEGSRIEDFEDGSDLNEKSPHIPLMRVQEEVAAQEDPLALITASESMFEQQDTSKSAFEPSQSPTEIDPASNTSLDEIVLPTINAGSYTQRTESSEVKQAEDIDAPHVTFHPVNTRSLPMDADADRTDAKFITSSGFFEEDDSRTPVVAAFSEDNTSHGLPSHDSPESAEGTIERQPRWHHRAQHSIAFSEVSVYHSVGTRDSIDSSDSIFFTPDMSKRGSRTSYDETVPKSDEKDALIALDETQVSSTLNENSYSPNTPKLYDNFERQLTGNETSPPTMLVDTTSTISPLPKLSAIPRRRKVPVLQQQEFLESDGGSSKYQAYGSPQSSSSTKPIPEPMDRLDREIDQILTTLTAPVFFSRDAAHGKGNTSQHIGLNHTGSPNVRRQVTPDLTLAPAQQNDTRRSRNVSYNDIKLYYLTPAGRDPIKLYVRLVGGSDERVMVRVGGGWADLADYLSEYALHHRRAATFSELPLHTASHTTRIPSAPPALQQKSSLTIDPPSASNIPQPRSYGTPKTVSVPRTISLGGNLSGRRSNTPTLRRPGTAGSDTNSIIRSPSSLSQTLSSEDRLGSRGSPSPISEYTHAANAQSPANNPASGTPQPSIKTGSKIPKFSSGSMFRSLGSVGKTKRVYRVSDVAK